MVQEAVWLCKSGEFGLSQPVGIENLIVEITA
jgi:hypothetical protein